MGGDEIFDETHQQRMASWIARKGLGAWEGFKGHPDLRARAARALQLGRDREFAARPPLRSNSREGNLHIHLHNAERGTRVDSGGDLIRSVKVNRGRAMVPAK